MACLHPRAPSQPGQDILRAVPSCKALSVLPMLPLFLGWISDRNNWLAFFLAYPVSSSLWLSQAFPYNEFTFNLSISEELRSQEALLWLSLFIFLPYGLIIYYGVVV